MLLSRQLQSLYLQYVGGGKKKKEDIFMFAKAFSEN